MFGKSLTQYLRFQGPVLGFIVGVSATRLLLSLAGVPDATTRWASGTVAMVFGVVYYGVAVQMRGVGSYKQLLGLSLIQGVVGEVIPIVGILIAIATGHDNVFTAPEFSGGSDGKNLGHVLGHVIVAFTLLPLAGWAIGSLVLAVTKKLSPARAAA